MPIILGADHICTSCTSIEEGAHSFQKFGFQTTFEEYNLPVVEEKTPFLRKVCESHDTVFLKPTGGVSVELIRHQGVLNGQQQAPYHVLLGTSKDPFNSAKIDDIGVIGQVIEQALEIRVVKRIIENFKISYYQPIISKNLASGVALVTLACSDLNLASSFWQEGLGFQFVKKSNVSNSSWHLLEFISPIPSWNLKLLLLEAPSPQEKHFLDDSGWTCLSFIVTSIEKSIELLTSYNITDVGSPYSISIGGNSMRLCFFRGPENILIELIQVERK